jgi:HSP20 family protein
MSNTGLQKDQKQSTTAATEATRNLTYTPRVDILEREDELVLLADVPGVKEEDVDLRFEKGELMLNCRCAPRHTDVKMLVQEYGVGDYYRVFTISEQIAPDKISASLQGGVLTVHLPKREAVKPRRIAIKGS